MSTSAAWSRYAKVLTNNVTNQGCGSSVKLEYEEWSSWIDLFTRDTIAVLGIFGNAIIIMIRMQMHLRNTFNKLLVALAFFDTFTLIMFLAVTIFKTSRMFHIMFPYFIWPFGNIAVRGSIFMTVVIAYERFMAVRHPLSFNIGQRFRTARYVFLVIIFDIIVNLPKFFEFEPDGCYGIRFTEMYKNKIYSTYNIALYALLPIINMAVLVYLYVKIYQDIKESHLAPERQTSQDCLGSAISRESMRKKESKQAGIFAGVVVTFIICRIPDMFLTIVQIVKSNSATEPPMWFLIAFKIRDICFILNSALNVVIYTCVSKQFRRDLRVAFLRLIFCANKISTNSSNVN